MIRRAQQSDSQAVWQVRNHPAVRVASFNPEEIDFESHDKWFAEKYFSESNNFCFVLEEEMKVAGYARFDFDEEQKAFVVSTAVNPEKQGKGFGSRLLSESLKQFAPEHPGLIQAVIKKSNQRSFELFQKNGFKIYNEDESNYYLDYDRTGGNSA